MHILNDQMNRVHPTYARGWKSQVLAKQHHRDGYDSKRKRPHVTRNNFRESTTAITGTHAISSASS
jgi:hypothetical protein